MKPIESVFRGSNAQLIEYIAPLYVRGLVLDATYGRGNWWDWPANNSIELVTNDEDKETEAEHNFDYRRFPWEWEGIYDTVCFDPPYVPKGGRETSGILAFDARYGLTKAPPTVETMLRLNTAGVVECGRVLRKGGFLVYKCSDYISCAKYQRGGVWSVTQMEAAGCELEDVIVHAGWPGPQPKTRNGVPVTQQHSRRAHSYLLVGRKR